MRIKESIAIAGSGAIATGLAACAARTPNHVLWARSAESAARAKVAVEKACERLGGDYDASNVLITTEIDALGSASFVVEAIVEHMATKCELLRRLDKIVRHDAIVASTTSSLNVEDLAQAAGRPGAFVGLHVFNPVPRMRLVEVAFPQCATADTRTRTLDLCGALDKDAIEVPTAPGFVVNGLLFPYLFNAVNYMEDHGVGPEMVDSCMQLGAGHPMGPIALLDYIGLDVSVAIGDALGCAVPQRLRALVADGHTGKKVGQGLYPTSHYKLR